jgi:hypothetical protein
VVKGFGYNISNNLIDLSTHDCFKTLTTLVTPMVCSEVEHLSSVVSIPCVRGGGGGYSKKMPLSCITRSTASVCIARKKSCTEGMIEGKSLVILLIRRVQFLACSLMAALTSLLTLPSPPLKFWNGS